MAGIARKRRDQLLAVSAWARQVGDFEGVVTWGLGLSHASCPRSFTLSGPSRLVVDVQI